MLLPASVKSKDLSGEIGWRLDELEDKFCDFLRLAQTVGGNLFPEAFISSGEKQWFMAVSITPQEMALTWILLGASSLARAFVRP